MRRAYDLVAEGFGPGANGPLLVTVALRKPSTVTEDTELADVQALVARLQAEPGVVAVTGPLPNRQLDAAVVIVQPRGAPNAESTQRLVRRLRDDVIPEATGSTELAGRVNVGGETAELIDLTDRIDARLYLCIAFVVAGAFILLMIVFRSILVPLKAAIMNLLSIGAAYGVVVAVFQWGWGRGLIGLEDAVPIEAFVPLMMFAILFGLSMDYEVFLLSRIREEYVRTGDNRESVATGLTTTARVITSAALIMISVFLSFVASDQPVVKMLGLGLAVAVAVDATIVRLVLVPATMELLGKANWWFPGFLDRIVPRIDVDVPSPAPVPPAAPATTPGDTPDEPEPAPEPARR
jgi:RND superfamily putative drug exporter